MSAFATPQGASYAKQQYSFIFQNNDFDLHFPATPATMATTPNMKIEMQDACLNQGLTYSFSGQSTGGHSSANSSFYVSDYEHSDTPTSTASFNESFDDWCLMTRPSSRRLSLDDFDTQGLASSHASMPASPAVYSPQSYQDGACNITSRQLQYSAQVSTPSTSINMHTHNASSFAGSFYSDYSGSVHSDGQSSTMFLSQDSPVGQFQFPQTFIDPAQTFCSSMNLATPFHSPSKPLHSPAGSFYEETHQETLHYFISPTPSPTFSPCRAPAKRRRGEKQSFSSHRSSGSSSSGTSITSASSQGNTSHNPVAERPKFFCNWPNCLKNPASPTCNAQFAEDHNGRYRSGVGFRRQEHLKRHMFTHTEPKSLPCRFCLEEGKESKTWTRIRNDNFKAHLKLHIKNADGKKKGTRTTYRKEAAMLLKWLEIQQGAKKKDKARKRKVEDVDMEEEEEVKEESSEVESSTIDNGSMEEIVRKYWFGDDE